MKKLIAATPLLCLAACGGAGLETAGSVAVPGPANGPGEAHSFTAPTQTKTYKAIAAGHSLGYRITDNYEYDKKTVLINGTSTVVRDDATRFLTSEGRGSELYVSDIGTIRNSGVDVTYDPKNAIYTLKINQGGIDNSIQFQDPAHHTAFDGVREPQPGVPNLEKPIAGDANWRDKGVQYFEVSQSTDDKYDVSTFFVELPGTSTKYVTYAGYVRNMVTKGVETTVTDDDSGATTRATSDHQLDRAAFAFGELTPTSAVPKSGSASYSGAMIASAILNPTLDNPNASASYYQWMSGTANLSVDFANNSVTANIAGTTMAPLFDRGPVLPPTGGLQNLIPAQAAVPSGASFNATGTATVDLVGTGGFTGGFNQAGFTWNGGAERLDVDIIGSSLAGAFYGPKAEEVGGSFRIVGGIPDQRVDVLGSFTGKQ
jgi:hypothetical protein